MHIHAHFKWICAKNAFINCILFTDSFIYMLTTHTVVHLSNLIYLCITSLFSFLVSCLFDLPYYSRMWGGATQWPELYEGFDKVRRKVLGCSFESRRLSVGVIWFRPRLRARVLNVTLPRRCLSSAYRCAFIRHVSGIRSGLQHLHQFITVNFIAVLFYSHRNSYGQKK